MEGGGGTAPDTRCLAGARGDSAAGDRHGWSKGGGPGQLVPRAVPWGTLKPRRGAGGGAGAMMGVSSFGMMTRAVKCCEISGYPARGGRGAQPLRSPNSCAGRTCVSSPHPFLFWAGAAAEAEKAALQGTQMSCLCFGCLGSFLWQLHLGLGGPQSPGGVTLKPVAGSWRPTAAVIGFLQGRAGCAHCELETGQMVSN